jgi:hypothetical protein
MDAEAGAAAMVGAASAASGGAGTTQPAPASAAPVAPTATRPRRFHGTVTLDPARAGRDAGRIADEVIAHLAGQIGAEVTVTLEIEARRRWRLGAARPHGDGERPHVEVHHPGLRKRVRRCVSECGS